MRLLKEGRRKTTKKTQILELRKYKSGIIANSKIFFSFSSKMEIKEEWAVLWKELVKINGFSLVPKISDCILHDY